MNSRENTLEILYVYYIVPLIELVVLNELFENQKKYTTSVRVELTILRLTVSRLSQLGHEVVFSNLSGNRCV